LSPVLDHPVALAAVAGWEQHATVTASAQTVANPQTTQVDAHMP
jgi:hypothetical protein